MPCAILLAEFLLLLLSSLKRLSLLLRKDHCCFLTVNGANLSLHYSYNEPDLALALLVVLAIMDRRGSQFLWCAG
ncbi:hypothetical protein EV13_0933 [Prochlorococcus sp. MIT 0702]|uniref:hypothetical protein n=1 Tax=Prochlorococcus sp. MIT 0701 TaxID=1499502 RepID=UPI0005337C63|nr:hypothetical protein EV12_0446 [Prochlorococcus sp. MIT 0701]KGG29715.1 hypothetical protein EV13_0933 [Prochlorococcus sp. MIT 0702]KGG34269.1 hypothetical protein EV14_1363 [Prochlorococcus sp. MIT 0703]